MLFPFHDDVPMRRTPLVMIALIVMNFVVFLWMRGLPSIEQDAVACRWGFMPARVHQFFDRQPITIPLEDGDGLTWPFLAPPQRQIVLAPVRSQILLSFLTCMFLHGGWLHLIGNMWFLWIFGDNIEDRLGHIPFLCFYLVGGLLASAAHWLAAPESAAPVIGASGAIAAVLGAYAITWPWARVRSLVFLFIFVTVVELPALVVLGLWFLLQLFAGATETQGAAENVAWWEHVGGFLAGLLLMPLASNILGLDVQQRPPQDPYEPVADEFGW